MDYGLLGGTGLRVSRLGFGCMRLPMMSPTQVDREKAIPLLKRAVELGVTYFDTAVGYCGRDSQRALGEAMEGMRKGVILSTKNPHYNKKDVAGWWKNLEDSLERLRTDFIDVYNFHGLNYETFERAVVGDDGLYKQMLKAKEQGLIRHICHSFHGTLDSLKKCIDTGLFESVTLQYNLLDQRLEDGIAYARENGIGIVIMGPVGGGRLGYPSEKITEIVGGVTSTPDLALRFVLSNEGVSVALSGMSTMQQLEENVATVSKAGTLSQEDHSRIEAAIQERKKLAGLYCTGCNYCMPCPDGVDIPGNFEILNSQRVFGLDDYARSRYATLGGKAALCRLCRKCVPLCPQELDIPARLSEAVMSLDERRGSVAGWSELKSATREGPGLTRVKLRYHLKNFADRAHEKVAVTVRAHREEQVFPGNFEIKNVGPFARTDKDLDVIVNGPLETLSLDSLIRYDDTRSAEHLHHIVALAEKSNGDSVDPHAGGIHVPGPLHPIHGSNDDVGRHSFDFASYYDAEKLTVWSEVEDDLLFLAREDESERGRADSIRIFLDGRKPNLIGRGGYEDGVFHVTLLPLNRESGKLRVVVSNKTNIESEMCGTDTGYRCRCAIPWSAFGRSSAPKVIGFDIALISHDEEGRQTLRLAWTGRSGQEGNTAAFGRLLLA